MNKGVKKLALFLSLFLLLNGIAYALVDVSAEQIAFWQMSKKFQPTLAMNFAKQINKKQINLIKSGFSTFSVLEIKTPKQFRNTEENRYLYRVACTVKYDTWQERYDLARIDKVVESSFVKTFDEYGRKCLTAKLTNKVILDKMKITGATLIATLKINQISIAKAGEIKQWLIRQQTGVMQGLFSHMLGDLKLAEQMDLKIKIPPQPGVESRAE